MDDFGLERFVEAQNTANTYEQAVRELRQGRKETHWMWFVFPQVAGLGRSELARRFAVSGLPEARAYLAHPVLGARLLECARALTELRTTDPVSVFGHTDAMKLRSSMTLFARAAPHERVFTDVLTQYFDGEPDPETLERLEPGADDGSERSRQSSKNEPRLR